MFYEMEIAGLKRKLPLCPVNDSLYIAGFVMFDDVEITVKTAEELLKRAPEFDIIVTCVEPLYSENNYEEKFTKYIYDNVNVLYEAQENYNTVCDWSGFVNDNFKTLKNFSEKHWANTSIYYDDKGNVDNDEFLYHWVNEINLYLAGYANEEQYKMLYKALAGEEKTATLESKTDIER